MADCSIPESGIYAIRVGPGIYIGSAVNLKRRWKQHKEALRRGKHHAKRLQGAWDMYGQDCAIFSVLEYVEDKARLVEREQFWISRANAAVPPFGYNTSPTAGSNLGARYKGAPKTDEWKALRSAQMMGHPVSDSTRAKLRSAKLGKKVHTPESKERLRVANLGRKPPSSLGRKHSPESRKKMSEAKYRIDFAKRGVGQPSLFEDHADAG